MPRYNLNREDVSIVLDALQNYLLNTNFEHNPNQIISLKKRLESKIEVQDLELDKIDVWSAFQERK